MRANNKTLLFYPAGVGMIAGVYALIEGEVLWGILLVGMFGFTFLLAIKPRREHD